MQLKEIDSCPGYWVSSDGDVYHYKNAKYCKLKPFSCKGYLCVTIKGLKYVGKLVLSTFHPTTNPNLRVWHIDGDKTNNRLSNLMWATCSEVQRYSRYTKEERQKIRARV